MDCTTPPYYPEYGQVQSTDTTIACICVSYFQDVTLTIKAEIPVELAVTGCAGHLNFWTCKEASIHGNRSLMS